MAAQSSCQEPPRHQINRGLLPHLAQRLAPRHPPSAADCRRPNRWEPELISRFKCRSFHTAGGRSQQPERHGTLGGSVMTRHRGSSRADEAWLPQEAWRLHLNIVPLLFCCSSPTTPGGANVPNPLGSHLFTTQFSQVCHSVHKLHLAVLLVLFWDPPAPPRGDWASSRECSSLHNAFA